MSKLKHLVRAMIISVTFFSSSVSAENFVPVLIGEIPELDACLSLAAISTTKPIILRASPSNEADALTTLKPHQLVNICDTTKKAPWVGVIVPEENGDLGQCAVSRNVPKQVPYDGPCKSGWIKNTEYKVIAG